MGALVKAMIVHSAALSPGQYQGQALPGAGTSPDHIQGHGVVGLSDVLDTRAEDNGGYEQPVVFVQGRCEGDCTDFSQLPNVANGASQTWEFECDGTRPLAATLAWSDPPANSATDTALVNDLDLKLFRAGEEKRARRARRPTASIPCPPRPTVRWGRGQRGQPGRRLREDCGARGGRDGDVGGQGDRHVGRRRRRAAVRARRHGRL